jgi:hypothetical protein
LYLFIFFPNNTLFIAFPVIFKRKKTAKIVRNFGGVDSTSTVSNSKTETIWYYCSSNIHHTSMRTVQSITVDDIFRIKRFDLTMPAYYTTISKIYIINESQSKYLLTVFCMGCINFFVIFFFCDCV